MAAVPHPDDTIAALASAPGSAGRGIVRVTGPETLAVVGATLAPPEPLTPGASAACYPRRLRLTGLDSPIPVDVCVWPGGRSYTRQPLVELHLVGSPPLLDAVLGELYTRGVRPAQPGEFTLRAFLAGRVDLLQAEAVLGVIDARGRHDLATALEQLGGGVSSQMVRLRGDLLDLLADLEAGLDFADEPIEFVTQAGLLGRLGLARDAVAELLELAQGRLRTATRPAVVLAGPPNAGKSTLFNVLVGAETALVSRVPGTTRDYLCAELELEGLPIALFDTAGEEPALPGVGEEAQKRRQEVLSRADLVVWCQPADARFGTDAPHPPGGAFAVMTKADLGKGAEARRGGGGGRLCVSARTGEGLHELREQIACRLAQALPQEGGLLGTTAARCRDSLAGALATLDRALAVACYEVEQELLAIEIRDALEELGKVVGAVYTDDLLDRIFSRFCIGK